MSTRRAPAGAPIHDNRYMSAPEYAQLRGVNAVAVAPRAAIVESAEIRALIWFLQAKSMQEGGLKKVADDLAQMFPARPLLSIPRGRWDRREPEPLHDALADLCVNPRRLLASSGTEKEVEKRRAIDAQPELNGTLWLDGQTRAFGDLLGALHDYKAVDEKRIKADFLLTDNCRPVWECLDFSARTGSVTLVNGLEGRGKTEAAKAWCAHNLGRARFVSLNAISSKTTAFRKIGLALGVGASLQRTATDMQARIEEVLRQSKLVLCLDEAHRLFNQGQRIYSRPELVDWIGTLSNDGIPVCLITTPQFMTCMVRAADQVGWNYRQFRRRIKRIKVLGDTSREDLMRVAGRLLQGAGASAIKLAVGYALNSRRDVSGLADVVAEAKEVACGGQIHFDHVDRAVREVLAPSDDNFRTGMEQARSARSGRRQQRAGQSGLIWGRKHTNESNNEEESTSVSASGLRSAGGNRNGQLPNGRVQAAVQPVLATTAL